MNTYHVIIALNSARKRKVGDIISLLESKGFEFKEKKVIETSPNVSSFDFETSELKVRCADPKFLDPYQSKFAAHILKRKIQYFLLNHVDLVFESNRDNHNVWNLRSSIYHVLFKEINEFPLIVIFKDEEIDLSSIDLTPEEEYHHMKPETLDPGRISLK